MSLTGTVAGLAGDANLVPARSKAVCSRVVALLETGCVTGNAHRVGRLVTARPMDNVTWRCVFLGQEMEPAFALKIPRDLQSLQASSGHSNQILLQWRHTKSVGHLKIPGFPVRTVRTDHEFIALPEESGRDALVLEFGIIEVAGHRFFGRQGHCLGMVRLPPLFRLILMTAEALPVINISNLHHRDSCDARSNRWW